jgi:hypothetical protein
MHFGIVNCSAEDGIAKFKVLHSKKMQSFSKKMHVLNMRPLGWNISSERTKQYALF